MCALSSFDYAVLRIVPRVDREEFLNAGVILYCKGQHFLAAKIHIDEQRLLALWPGFELDVARLHLEAFCKICKGDADAGPIAALPQRERFHWLVSPRSTIIQVSPVHSGLCEAPHLGLEKLLEQLVRV